MRSGFGRFVLVSCSVFVVVLKCVSISVMNLCEVSLEWSLVFSVLRVLLIECFDVIRGRIVLIDVMMRFVLMFLLVMFLMM